jgi:hypothetical protein
MGFALLNPSYSPTTIIPLPVLSLVRAALAALAINSEFSLGLP